MFTNSFWALVPAIVAIVFALISKEVYISLFIGIVLGAFFITDFKVVEALTTIFQLITNGLLDDYSMKVIIFLVLLGILVVLVNKAGGSKAYGDWSSKKIKSRKGVIFATIGLGAIISVDDYFNCLTVGSVMRPVTDRHNISRAKLSYLLDSIAAPVCVLCPISSWAVYISSNISEGTGINGFSMFLNTVPFNLYALLTIIMLVSITLLKIEFGKMKTYEVEAAKGNDISATDVSGEGDELNRLTISSKGKVYDLVIPIASLIVFSIIFMLYTGGLFSGEHTFTEAFGNSDSALSLCCGAFITIIICMTMYLPRKVLTFKQFTSSFTVGFKSMVPAILILTLAWGLKGVCDGLEAGKFVGRVVQESGFPHQIFPAILFLVALGLAFSTGSSWGTFGILIPIVIPLFSVISPTLFAISIAGILSGGVCGDHISPISDTTILASTGAKCNHIVHVSTQMTYALLIAGISFVGFIIAGFTESAIIAFLVSLVLLTIVITIIYLVEKKNHSDFAELTKDSNNN